MTVKMDRKVIQSVTQGPGVQRALLDIGNQVAEVAAGLAPKESGGGASSIRAELVTVNGIPVVHVSWDQDHFYMAFAETGTEHQKATPFLRPALARFS